MNEGWIKPIIITVIGTVLAGVVAIWLGIEGGYVDGSGGGGAVASGGSGSSVGSSSGKSTNFVITDELGPEQIAEEVTLLVEGRNVGTLKVDQNNRRDELKVSVPGGPGKYSYTASSDAVFRDGRSLSGTGQGTIDVSDNKVFELQGSFSGNTWQIALVER